MTTKLTFETTDFGLACGLATAGFQVTRIKPITIGRSAFVFEGDLAKIRKASDNYWADNLLVSAQAYHHQSKILKNRLYGEGKTRSL